MPCPVFLGMRAGVSDEDFMTSFQIMQLVGYSLPGGCLNLNEVGWGGWSEEDWLGAFIKAQCVGGRFDFYFYFTE